MIEWLLEQIEYARKSQENNYLNKSYFQALEDAYVSVLDKLMGRSSSGQEKGL